MDFLKNSGLLNTSLINPTTGINNNTTKKCKLEFTTFEKRKRMLTEYCKIISKNQSYIETAFLKSFEKYSSQMFNNFNPKDFITFVQNNIIEYLKPIFQDNRFTQYAFMIDLKPLVTEILIDVIREEIKTNSSKKINNIMYTYDLDTNKVYNRFLERLRERGNTKTSFLKKMENAVKIFGGQPTNIQSQMSNMTAYPFYPMQQPPNMNAYPFYPMQQPPLSYPIQQVPLSNMTPGSAQTNKSNSVNAIEKDEIKKITEVAEFFKKDIDEKTVNTEILEIIKNTFNKALESRMNELYSPLIKVVQDKIKTAVSDIGRFDSNIKIVMLVQMLENSFDFVVNTIKETINKVKVERSKNPSLNLKTTINKIYDTIVFPPEMNIVKRGGKKKILKLRKTKKNKKSKK